MNKKTYQFFFSAFILLSSILFAACKGEQFHINGTIANAKDSILYFEHNTLSGFKVIDSIKLADNEGKFAFSGDKIDNPEFYRLRIAQEIINIAIDSTETVNIVASYPNMATQYEVKGSYENEKIKELALMQMDLQSQCQNIYMQSPANADSIINELFVAYKQNVTTNYIFKEPMKAYSYFALFQYIVVGNEARLIFNPVNNPKDNKVFGAVATSWDTFYPSTERGQNLHNITLKGMNNQRIVESNQKEVEIEASETGIIDLPLLDNKGRKRSLTELKGKVVLLNFHVFASDQSTQYIMYMRDLYAKYQNKGLEVYMVSLDDNEHFWKGQVANLPWINVFDNKGLSDVYTAPATATPIVYLIDRENNVVKNPAQLKDLEQEIQKLL